MRRDSISSVSSHSSATSDPAAAEDNIQIFVKNLNGTIIPLSVPASTTVGTLKSLLALRHNRQPQSLRLVFAGRHLSSPDAPLSAAGITSDSTLHLALPLRGGMAKKPTCDYKKGAAATAAGDKAKCGALAQRIVGDCGFCGGHFCSKHRLLESHNCPNLEDCKKESHDRNRERLESERTVVVRGV